MLENIGRKAKDAAVELSKLDTKSKNNILTEIKNSLEANRDHIKIENAKDMEAGRKSKLSDALMDRLLLDDGRIDSMINSIDEVIDLDDPVGLISNMRTLENGLIVGKKTSPMGVIGIIYESRPDVTLNCALLTIKSSNGLILKGGSEAINSNIAIEEAIRQGITKAGFNPDFVQLIKDTSRDATNQLMKLNEYVDLLIPRGGKGLISTVVKESTVPVLQTGDGNCHVYIDKSGDIDMAIDIIENSKTQRTGVCNAMESLLIHEDIEDEFYKKLDKLIKNYQIEVYADEISFSKLEGVNKAREEDYYKEYLDMAFSIKVVKDLDQAIDHINTYGTHHSDVIVTQTYENSQRFLTEVDSSCVYVNASSRFTDGGQLGLGAEMGISTQKMHARGPVGLKELTSEKYIIYGNGQVRE